MAKIKHNNFLDTVDEVFTNAKNAGVIHLEAQGESFTGRKIGINKKELFHFGTTGYLGLEQDPRLKKAAIHAIEKYGTQFPLSKSYISHPLYRELEEKVREMYGHPTIITKNSTLGHMAVIPCAVRDEDGVILDHQVHWSVQNAVQMLKTRGIPVEMIRHNNMDMLEHKIRELSDTCSKIWYMADGVYSMYGDYAPVVELLELSNRYPQLHLYFDDVHGMSWKGTNGTGYVMDMIQDLQENMLLFGTLSKTFGASGAVVACGDQKLYAKIKNYGGPLTFSAQLEPASVAAASESARIHLSPEIYELQKELQSRITYFNQLLEETDLPLVRRNDSPVFYIGTGLPLTGYNFVQRLMREGFYVNLGLYPAVPVKNTGVRITISRHNQKEEIKALVQAMVFHHSKALEETNSSIDRVHRAFRMTPVHKKTIQPGKGNLLVRHEQSIRNIDKTQWNQLLGRSGTFDWEGQLFLENVFSDKSMPEHHWSFHYFIISDQESRPVAATFFSDSLWKDDLLAPPSTSLKIESKRKNNPLYLTSKVLSMGSLFSEGDHLYLDRSHPEAHAALKLLLKKVEELSHELDSDLVVLRDFGDDKELNQVFHDHGFIRTAMPDSSVMENLTWNTSAEYISSLSSRSRRHFKKDIEPYTEKFEVIIREKASPGELDHFYSLYRNVKNNNPGLNTFTFPRNLFTQMSEDPNWEFLVLYLKQEYDTREVPLPVGVMFCYKNLQTTYVPGYIGMDYEYSREYPIYRQLLFQTILRARSLSLSRVEFGLTASFEKRKIGARAFSRFSYIQAKDNFSMELLGVMQNEI